MDAGKYDMRICVVGVGNIGMRYVQGILKKFPDAKLILIDEPGRIQELEKLELGDVELFSTLDGVQGHIDGCVVATSCGPRLEIYKRCLELNPRFIILEKYLFKSRDEFAECLRLPRVPTFVNQWMYGSETFHCLFEEEATSVEIVGCDWGLACNAVHWIDVLKRHLNITHLEVGSDTAISKVFPSKRSGYEEIYGELVFVDRDSAKTFRLVDYGDERFAGRQEITVDEEVYLFDFQQVKRGDTTLRKFPYFSDLIGEIVGGIVENGKCHLPTLEESVSQHLLLEEMFDQLSYRPNIT